MFPQVLADAGAEIDATTRFMDTPLHRAASGGHPGAVQVQKQSSHIKRLLVKGN